MPAAPRCFLLSLVSLVSLDAASRYEIDLGAAASGMLRVTLDAACSGRSAAFQMPVWNATYHVRDFSRFVSNLSVSDAAGARQTVAKPDPSRWIAACPAGGRLRVEYDVLADRPGPFGAFADANYATLNLAQILLYPIEARNDEFTLVFAGVPPGRKTALTLEKSSGGGYRAPSYDRLTDTPVLIADFVEDSFTHDGAAIRVAAFGEPGGFNLELLTDSAKRIVAGAAAIMGGLPLSRYTFVYCFKDAAGGGMEYRNGTLIFGPSECAECALSSLTAHEFFHLWNVKRIRPASLEPLDHARPMPSPSLWFVEGVTSTFAEFIRLRAGAVAADAFLARLGKRISRYMARPARLDQSAEQGSVEAWLEGYPEYDSPQRSVSYYLRGELIGHLLDLTIRRRTKNRRGLDDVMRLLNERYAAAGRFYEDTDAIERAVSEVAGSDMSAVIAALVRRPDPIDWNDYLRYAGYRLSARKKETVDFGFSLADSSGNGIFVSAVTPAGAARQAGFRVGDRIVRYQSRPLDCGAEELAAVLRRAVGRSVSLGVERQGGFLEIEIAPRMTETVAWRIVSAPRPTPAQLRVRKGWLRRTAGP